MTDLPSIVRDPSAGGPPAQLVVLIHGLGAEGADLIELAPVLAASMPHALFAAPDAPFAYDMAPFGRQWFSVQSRAEADLAAGIGRADAILASFLTGMLERHGLPSSALALAGFSQGSMMALHTGLRMLPPPAAIIGFSGGLIEAPGLRDQGQDAPAVLLVHGALDEVVPAESMPAAERVLRARGVPVECCLRPGLGHAIDPEGLDRARGFLARAFRLSA